VSDTYWALQNGERAVHYLQKAIEFSKEKERLESKLVEWQIFEAPNNTNN